MQRPRHQGVCGEPVLGGVLARSEGPHAGAEPGPFCFACGHPPGILWTLQGLRNRGVYLLGGNVGLAGAVLVSNRWQQLIPLKHLMLCFLNRNFDMGGNGDHQDAARAIAELNDTDMLGRLIFVREDREIGGSGKLLPSLASAHLGEGWKRVL